MRKKKKKKIVAELRVERGANLVNNFKDGRSSSKGYGKCLYLWQSITQ